MSKYLTKSFFINLSIIGSFAIISLLYFNPLLSGKQIKQSDIGYEISKKFGQIHSVLTMKKL